MTLWRFWALITLLSLTACDSQPTVRNYFPLQPGLSWEYRHQISSKETRQPTLYTVTNLSTTQLGNQTATIRRTNNGRDYYLVHQKDGIYRYASRTLFETHPIMDEPARLVMPLPYFHKPPRTWSSSTASYAIQRISASSNTGANPIPHFNMTYRIVSHNETVKVPAGVFKDCLLIEGEATLSIFADPRTGYAEIPVKTKEWYAPDVGLVRLERTEPLDTLAYQGGQVLFELLRFKQ